MASQTPPLRRRKGTGLSTYDDESSGGPLSLKQPSAPLVDRLASTADSRHAAIRATRYGHRIRAYDKNFWARALLSPYGRNFPFLLKPMFFVTVIACVATPLAIHYEDKDRGGEFCTMTVDSESALGYIIVSLTFLMVFRLNRAALRHYEARQLCGNMMINCRDAMTQSNAVLPDRPASRDALCAFGVAFPVTFMWHMWGMVDPTVFDEKRFRAMLEGLFDEEILNTLIKAKNRPMVLTQMALLELESAFAGLPDTPGKAEAYGELVRIVRGLGLPLGGCERIQGTPLPYVYVAHLRSFLLIVLGAMPIFYACRWRWATIPLSLLVAAGLLGIEAASVECEQPFSPEPSKNHHDVEKFCCIMSVEAQELIGVTNDVGRRSSEGIPSGSAEGYDDFDENKNNKQTTVPMRC